MDIRCIKMTIKNRIVVQLKETESTLFKDFEFLQWMKSTKLSYDESFINAVCLWLESKGLSIKTHCFTCEGVRMLKGCYWFYYYDFIHNKPIKKPNLMG